jgi:cytochrome c biogenesis protein CcmG, thiol:disulfide interchange protein DsbE
MARRRALFTSPPPIGSRRACVTVGEAPCNNAIVMKCIASVLLAVAFACAMAPARAAGVGDAAPPLSLATAKGDTVALDGLRGQVVYVDFWASWCGPCKRSFPWMNEISQRYGDKGLAVIAVNVDRKREDAQRFLAQTPARFTVVYDAAGVTPAAWAVKGMPSSYLIDRAGRVVMVEQGFRDEQKPAVEQRIRELLAAR